MPTDLLIYALVAAGLVFWLKSVLGTRHGEEQDRPNPFTAPPPASPAADLNVQAVPTDVAQTGNPTLALPRNVTLAEDAHQGLSDILSRDETFEPGAFIMAAQDAFVIIVESFARGDRETLKNLLSDDVYRSFENVIRNRDISGEKVETEIHAIRRADIMAARLERNAAFVTVRFTADETCVIRDAGGRVLSGHPDRVTEMVDLWTFTRDIKSKDPRWLVCETRDGDTKEDHKTPVPDAG